MTGIRKRSLEIIELEKRQMLDAALGSLATTVVLGEQTVNTAPQILDGDVTVTGSTIDFTGLDLSITTDGGAANQLGITNEGSGAGQIGVSGSTITYSGIAIGTMTSNGQNGAALTIELNGNANMAAIENLIEAVNYSNASNNPALSRTINFALEGLFSENMTLSIAPFNDAPVIDINSGLTVNEGGTQTLTAAMLDIRDDDTAGSDVTISITTPLTNGRIELSTNAGVAINSFTLADLDNGHVRYVHNGSETLSDSLTFTVSDGEHTLADTPFSITVNAVDDAPVLDINDGADVFQGFTTDIGGSEIPTQFGTEILNRATAGTFGSFHGLVNGNVNTQISLIFTTPANLVNSNPGQTLFETGNSSRGLGLYLNNQNQLALFAGAATAIPRLASSLTLDVSTQYAVVIEIDQTNDEIRMHYAQAGDFNWFSFGRAAEDQINNWTDTSIASNNGAGYGVFSSQRGGFNGTAVGPSGFSGTLDSPLIVTRFPATATTFVNTNLVFTDNDTAPASIVYTITDNVDYGTLYRNGIALGLGDTFTQADLNNALIKYTHNNAVTPDDSFTFSVSDGSSIIAGNTYVIDVNTANNAPDIPDQSLNVSEDATNGAVVGTLIATDPDTVGGQTLSFSIQGGTGAGIFAVDAASGVVSVIDSSTLDYETTTSYTLLMRVTDDGPGSLFFERLITVNVQDVNENTAPVIAAGGPYYIDENVGNNTVVATVSANDAQGDNITYSIVSGNTNSAFKINSSTGVIQVNGNGKIDFEALSTYNIRVRATDNNALPLFSERTFQIRINDLNEGPSLQIDQVINTLDVNVKYNAANGNFYKMFSSTVAYNTALNNASNTMLNGANGHLLTITSASENTFVDNNVLTTHIWLAATDSETEGVWKWEAGPETGSIFSLGGTATAGFYENWNGTEPNSGSNANNAYMNTNGTWYDQNGGTRAYVVEWESYDVINNRNYIVDYSAPNGSDIANGTIVGRVQGGDQDAGDTLSYSITGGNADGIFEIDSATGQLRILDNTNLDTALQHIYTLTIRVQDSAGLFDTANIDVTFNQLTSIGTNEILDATEGVSTTITTADLNIVDNDTPAADLVITITDQPDHGFIALSTSPAIAITNFTQADLVANRVIYVHDGTENFTDNFGFSVSDGSSTISGQTFNIDVTPVNDSPVINVNTGTTVLEGGSTVLTNAMLSTLDADDGPADLTYTVNTLTRGSIEVNGSIQNTFTQSQLNAGLVRFIHSGAEGNGVFNVTVADQGEDSATTSTVNFTLTVTPVNDAPTIVNNTGTTIIEGGTRTITNAMLSATDSDDTPATLIYTLSGIQNGTVQLSTNPGVPIVSFTQGDIDNNRVRFVHDGNEANARFNFSVADGGEDSALPATGTFILTKTPVNDAPTIGINAGASVNQNSIVIIKNSVLAANDPDDSGAGLTYTITGTLNGQLERLSTPNVAITTFTQADINSSQIIFRHSGPVGPASFNFTLADGGEDSAGTASGVFNLSVDNTNDSPTITVNITQTIDKGSTLALDTTMLDSFDPDDLGDGLVWHITNVQSGRILVNGIASNTFTQTQLDNGQVSFTHDSSATLTAGFTATIADGGEDNAITDSVFFKLNINPSNTLAQIDNNETITLAEGDTATITSGDLSISDADNVVWYNANWQYRQGMTIDHTLVAQDLTDYVLLIDGSNFTSDFWSNVKNDGSDIVITLGDGTTKLSRELVTINRGAGTMELHVKIPALSSTMDTQLYIYYGNILGSETNSTADTYTQYNHVYHMNQLNAVDVINGINGTNSGGGSIVTGVMGNGLEFSGAGNIDIATINGAGIRTVSFWYNPDSDGGGDYGTILGSNTYNDGIRHTATNEINLRRNTVNVVSSSPDFNTDKHLVFAYDSVAGSITMYENGILQDTDAFSGWYNFDFLIGIAGATDRAIDGTIDEIRFSANTLSAGWAATEYANQSDPSSFIRLTGQQAYQSQSLSYSVSTLPANGTLFLDANNNGVVDGGEGLSVSSTFTQSDIDNNRLKYIHNGGETVSDSFQFTVTDGTDSTATQTFSFTITPVNDAPVLSANTGLTMDEGATSVITAAQLSYSDSDDVPADLVYTASNITNGHIEVNGLTTTTFTQDDVNNNRVRFIHDGSETITAGFDFTLTDGDTAITAQNFAITITPVNDAPTLIINDGNPNVLDLNDYIMTGYGGAQDVGGTITISPDGSTLTMSNGNMWKQIAIPYTLTANTVLSFEFFSSTNLEVQGIGFENDGAFGILGYQLSGTQTWTANNDFRTYQAGDGWVRFDIDIGSDYTGVVNALVFAMDNDNNLAGTQAFRNINFYENGQVVEINEGGSLTLTNSHLNSVDPDDTPATRIFTATNITNGHIEVSGVTQNTFTQADINNGDVVFIHNGSETLTAGFDIALMDDEGAGTDTGRFDIIVNAVDESPVAVTNSGITVTEGATTTITTAALNASDIDTIARDVVFTLTDNVDNGRIALSTNPSTAINSFTLADLQNNRVVYIHNGSEMVADSFTFTITDGTTTLPADTFTITVTPVNDPVNLVTNTGAQVGESGFVTITNAMLNTTDADNTAAQITYTITGMTGGWVELSTNSGYPVTSFTQDDLNNNRVIFRHDGASGGAADFDFSVNDTGAGGTTPATATFNLNITPSVNDAPVIAISNGVPTTIDFSNTTVTAYDPTGVGDGQGGTATQFRVSDDGSVLTIYGNAWKRIPLPMTITADTVLSFDFRSTKEGEIHGIGFDNDNTFNNGRFAFELFGTDNNGSFNQSYNTYSLGDGWVRYEIPVGDFFTGAATHLFFVADDDTGADGISQFRNVSVYEANPLITASEGGSVLITNANLNAFDTDNVPNQLTYTASNITNGHIEVNGVTTTTFTQDDVNNNRVRFIHDGSETVSASLDITLTDAGGLTDSASLSLTITPVNDAPVLSAYTGLTMDEGATGVITAAQLSYSDSDDVPADLVYTASNITNGHIEVNGLTTTTFTQDDVNNNRVRFIHDGSETITAGFDFTLTDGDAAITAQNFAITITPVNDSTPTDIMLDNSMVTENALAGTLVGTLSTTDADTPDNFTFTLVNNPGNYFEIQGNELRVLGAIDFELTPVIDLTIRVTDGAGHSYDKVMSIQINDVIENTAGDLVPLPQSPDPQTGISGGDLYSNSTFNFMNKREIFRVSDILQPFGPEFGGSYIMAALDGANGMLDAFYGQGYQILRGNTAGFLPQEVPALDGFINVQDQIQHTAQDLENPAPSQQQDNLVEMQDSTNNLREILLQLQNENMAANENSMASIYARTLQSDFQSVLSYQEQKLAALRDALMNI